MLRVCIRRWPPPWELVFTAWLALVLPTIRVCAEQNPPDLAAMRHYYLDQLIYPQAYLPGKNSFLIQKMHRGDSKTLLQVTGGGSVRHIWSTWSIPGDNSDVPAPRRILMRVFVDGRSKASIAGYVDELCQAAEATGKRFVPLPAFNYQGAFNFYLPIMFSRGIRIEIEAADEVEEFYTQIDYRSEEPGQPEARLVSEESGGSLKLDYLGVLPSWQIGSRNTTRLTHTSRTLEYGKQAAEFRVSGPGMLRELSLQGDSLDDLELQVFWDDHEQADVQAPLRYLFADFKNAALESGPGRRTCYFPMPFRKRARVVLRSLTGKSGRLTVTYCLEPRQLRRDTLYFHARYAEATDTRGYEQYPVLEARGPGVFVGVNLFDSGHNHGGGDAALLDAGTSTPRVLHGICGEDYFGFAWHHFGTMTPLTGAPAHERRYRLHLENPYPFHDSIRFLFGVFARQHPKSVAFWYAAAGQGSDSHCLILDAPWKILGPVSEHTALPDSVSAGLIESVVSINEPTPLKVAWQDASMRAGFLDATYQFRHYAMTERGTGFVAGAGKMEMITWMNAKTQSTVKVVLGHDDRVLVRVNGKTLADVPARRGFGPFPLMLPLKAGWNRIAMTVYNHENVNWRWWGISLALNREQSRSLQFRSEPPGNHP
ncbi:MAG TPA: DUF2961 domain-containing protein [Terriglobales bacterium]